MLNINSKIYMYHEPVHMLKSFESLSAIVQREFPGEIFTGAYFIFLNKLRDKMKILTWDSDGYVILYKRIEKGVFLLDNSTKSSLSRREFLMLFEGIKPRYLDHRFKLKKY